MRFFFFSMFICCLFPANAQFKSLNMSFGAGKIDNGLFLYNPSKTSNIQRTSQFVLNVGHTQQMKNRKYFGFSLGGQFRMEHYEASLYYIGNPISESPIQFNKLSYNGTFGFFWRFPLIKHKLFIAPGFNLGLRVYRSPNTRRVNLDGFESSGIQYIVDLNNVGHFQLNTNLNGRLLYQCNDYIGLYADFTWNSTESFNYLISVQPCNTSYSSSSSIESILKPENYFQTSVYSMDFSIGLTFNLNHHEK